MNRRRWTLVALIAASPFVGAMFGVVFATYIDVLGAGDDSLIRSLSVVYGVIAAIIASAFAAIHRWDR